MPVAVETFHALQQRQHGEAAIGGQAARVGGGRVPGQPAQLGRPQRARRTVPGVRQDDEDLLSAHPGPPDSRAMQDRLVWQAASLLLAYPDDGQAERLDIVEELLGHIGGPAGGAARTDARRAACSRPDGRRDRLRRDLRHAASVPPCI